MLCHINAEEDAALKLLLHDNAPDIASISTGAAKTQKRTEAAGAALSCGSKSKIALRVSWVKFDVCSLGTQYPGSVLSSRGTVQELDVHVTANLMTSLQLLVIISMA
ncbi:hypothetical protein PVAP13_9NG071686 [Panicum virgatum]|uniref:Uncharacterized protein n=1 Tax=Panicum virgatum TaxID=38727 RepID=A0A8T0MCF3_PANVG|nr:hypothetical protein PVAP13_9NG071686 [Panicum virgatum]